VHHLRLAAALVVLAAGLAPAQDEPKPPVLDLSPVVVTPTRGEEPLLEVPQAISTVDAAKMRKLLPQNTPDALLEEPGLVIQRSHQGGGSPVLRGRSGKDVLLLIDGQRFSNTTFRRNHPYLNTVDAFALEAIEVLRGPASVLYGSDAMGGAINLLLRRRELLGVNDWGGGAHLQYDTVNDGLVSHVDGEAEVDGFGVFAGYTWRHFDDLAPGRVGSNPI
jgi:outer membrane receptor protein involved in Fe transport